MGHVVVGVDRSANAAAALRWAAREAALRGDRLEVVHAWDYPYSERLGHDVQGELEQHARAELDAIVEAALPGAAELTRTVAQGSPTAVLLKASEHADLLVLGTRGHGAFAGMLLGSVSQHCAQHARCPLVLIPAPPPP